MNKLITILLYVLALIVLLTAIYFFGVMIGGCATPQETQKMIEIWNES